MQGEKRLQRVYLKESLHTSEITEGKMTHKLVRVSELTREFDIIILIIHLQQEPSMPT